jgi:hypothetical protein
MNYSEPDDQTFLRLVHDGRIGHFGHREHLRLAFLAACSSETVDEVVARCRSGIRAVATAQGAPDRYDETITAAWAASMLQIAATMPDSSFHEVLAAHPELEDPRFLDTLLRGVALPVTRGEPRA